MPTGCRGSGSRSDLGLPIWVHTGHPSGWREGEHPYCEMDPTGLRSGPCPAPLFGIPPITPGPSVLLTPGTRGHPTGLPEVGAPALAGPGRCPPPRMGLGPHPHPEVWASPGHCRLHELRASANHPFPVTCQLTLNKHTENTSGEGFLLNWKKGNEAFERTPSPARGVPRRHGRQGGLLVSQLLYHHAATVQGPRARWRPEGPRRTSPGPPPPAPTVSPSPDAGLEHPALGLTTLGGAVQMERLGDENLLPSWKPPHLALEGLVQVTDMAPEAGSRCSLGPSWPACTQGVLGAGRSGRGRGSSPFPQSDISPWAP